MALKNFAKKLIFRAQKLTAKYRKLPDFIILGTQRGGTTSLSFYLDQHPQIFMPRLKKEIHYFDLNYKKGILWYKAYFPISTKKLSGEATPYYLFHPHVAERIKKDLPNCKFIVLLREPVLRAYSQFKKEKSEGNDKIESFENAFNTENERTENETLKMLSDKNYNSFAHQRFTYFSRGLYFKQIKFWFQYFKPEQFLFIKSESFFSNPKKELKKVFDFLGIQEVYPDALSIRNQGKDSTNEPMKEEYYNFYKEDAENLKRLIGQEFNWSK